MFGNIKRAALVVASVGVVALAGASGAQAGYSQFHVGTEANPLGGSESMAVAAESGQSRLVVNGAIKFECNITYGEGAIVTGLFSNSGTEVIGSIVPKFDDCMWALGLEFAVDCANPPSGTTNLAVTDISTPFAGTAAGEIVNIDCVVTLLATGCTAEVTGSVQGSYTNAVTPSTAAVLSVFTAGQNLTVSNSGCPAIVPNGTAQFGAPTGTGLGLSDIDYTVTTPASVGDQPYLTPTV